LNFREKWFFFPAILLTLLLISGCSQLALDSRTIFNPQTDKTKILLVVVEYSLYPFIKPSIDQYSQDLVSQGCTEIVTLWNGGTVGQLRELLSSNRTTNNIDGAFLIGNLPCAWYESNCFNNYQDFPTDLYLSDFKAVWTDNDNNGVFDSHTALHTEIYTSRLIGSADQVNKYFGKVHDFRQEKFGAIRGGYIFKDDAWMNFRRGDTFGMANVSSTVTLREDVSNTTKTQYVSDVTGADAEYVFQWIHANPSSLFIAEQGTSNDIDIPEIDSTAFRGLFYNLFDCNASRFTQDNIAMSYLLGSGLALATLGSTKTGGNYNPVAFNYVLQNQGTWGDAFKYWYNEIGATDDCWFLGMTILGDPALVMPVEKSGMALFNLEATEPPAKDEMAILNSVFEKLGKIAGEEDYTIYKSKNLQDF
jgi:hypothetical protein